MTREQQFVEGYLTTVEKLEPEISPVDQLAAMTSIAISLKRIADALTIGRIGVEDVEGEKWRK